MVPGADCALPLQHCRRGHQPGNRWEQTDIGERGADHAISRTRRQSRDGLFRRQADDGPFAGEHDPGRTYRPRGSLLSPALAFRKRSRARFATDVYEPPRTRSLIERWLRESQPPLLREVDSQSVGAGQRQPRVLRPFARAATVPGPLGVRDRSRQGAARRPAIQPPEPYGRSNRVGLWCFRERSRGLLR